MDNPIKKGYLEAYAKGVADEYQWRRRYYILYGQSERAQARLDWYDSEADYVNTPTIRKTIYLEQIDAVFNSRCEGRSHVFELEIKQQTHSHKFSALDDIDLAKWVNHLKDIKETSRSQAGRAQLDSRGACAEGEEIYEAPPRAQSYKVGISETEASKSCGLSGHYNLVVSNHHLSLQNIKNKQTLYSWPYKLIRRYGRSSSSFTLEAGRKCDSGPGVFTFTTEHGNDVFTAMQEMTNAMRKKSVTGTPPSQLRQPDQRSSIHSPTETSPPPTLPNRNYGPYVHLDKSAENQRGQGRDSPDAIAAAQLEGSLKAPSTHDNLPLPDPPTSPKKKPITKKIFGGLRGDKSEKQQKDSKNQASKGGDKQKVKKSTAVVPPAESPYDASMEQAPHEYVNVNDQNGRQLHSSEAHIYDVYDADADNGEARYSSVEDELGSRYDSGGQYSQVFNSLGDDDEATYAEPETTTTSMSEMASQVYKQELSRQASGLEDAAYDSIDLRSAPNKPLNTSKQRKKSAAAAAVAPDAHLYGQLAGDAPPAPSHDGECLYDEIDAKKLPSRRF